jgi:hypothetical protein
MSIGPGGTQDPSGAIGRSIGPAPGSGPGEKSGDFFAPTSTYYVTQRQPYYRVQIWRISDGQQWQVLPVDKATKWNEVGDFVTSVSTSHNIGEAAGQFSIGLLPIRLRINNGDGRTHTWAELLKPMDYVEITLASSLRHLGDKPEDIHDGVVAGNSDMPYIVMRGFVTNVRVVDSVDGQSGQPRRRVMVNGMNFGKLWTMYRMYLLAENNENFGSKYAQLFYGGATPARFLTPAELMGIVYGGLFKPQLALLAKTLPDVLKHKVYCDVPSDGRYKLSPQLLSGVSSFQGPLDSLIRQYATVPYTEFYTFDEPWPTGTPVTIWRWSPLLNRANRFPLPDHIFSKPAVRVLHAYEIQEHDIGSSDSDAITYFCADLTQSKGPTITAPKFSAPGYLDDGKLAKYGFRPFEPSWPWVADRPKDDAAVATDPTVWAATAKSLTSWLAQCYEHTIDNMEGQIVANGRPDIHVGEYLDVPEAGYRYYVESVNHSLIVGQGFTTSISVTRGLPQRDLPKWVLPAGHQFQNTGASQGQESLGKPDTSKNGSGYIAPPSKGKTSQPTAPNSTPTNTKPATPNTNGGGAPQNAH